MARYALEAVAKCPALAGETTINHPGISKIFGRSRRFRKPDLLTVVTVAVGLAFAVTFLFSCL
jgi:hypothetical protein